MPVSKKKRARAKISSCGLVIHLKINVIRAKYVARDTSGAKKSTITQVPNNASNDIDIIDDEDAEKISRNIFFNQFGTIVSVDQGLTIKDIEDKNAKEALEYDLDTTASNEINWTEVEIKDIENNRMTLDLLAMRLL
jgi:hypothetical protein